jgi:hypothetical protein
MKRCPECNRKYDDDTLRFCLDDGKSLVIDGVAPTKAGVTMVLPPPEGNQPTLREVGRPDVPPPAPAAKDEARRPSVRAEQLPIREVQGSSNLRSIIGIILALALVLTVAGLGLWGLTFGRRLPLLLLCLAGLVLGFIRSKRHPKASLMTALGLGLYLLVSFVYAGVLHSLPSLVQKMQISYTSTAPVYIVAAVIDDLGYAAMILLLVVAAFTGRGSKVNN